VFILGYLLGLALCALPVLILALWAWGLYGKAQQRRHAAKRAAIDNALAARELLP